MVQQTKMRNNLKLFHAFLFSVYFLCIFTDRLLEISLKPFNSGSNYIRPLTMLPAVWELKGVQKNADFLKIHIARLVLIV